MMRTVGFESAKFGLRDDYLDAIINAAREEGHVGVDIHTYDNRFANLTLALVLSGTGGSVTIRPREFNDSWRVRKTYSADGQEITFTLDKPS